MSKSSSRRLNLSQLVDATLRLVHYLPSRLREAFHWWLFRTPFLHGRTPEQLAILESGRPFLMPSGPYMLKGYRYPGKGPTVVLTHGWQGSAASWFCLVPLLVEAGFSVITFDAPGHSGKPRVATLPVYAQGLQDVVELFSPVYALVGHSFGGMASARVARELPDLQALVIVGTPDKVRTLVDGFARKVRLQGERLQSFERRIRAALPIPIEEEETSLYVSTVSCPMLVLHDEDDDVASVADAHDIAAAGRASLHISQGLGHRTIIRDNDMMGRVVDFLLDPPGQSSRGQTS